MRFSLRVYFFFNDTATTEIYTLSLHDALPISIDLARRFLADLRRRPQRSNSGRCRADETQNGSNSNSRSEEHTSELQSHSDLVCRLLLEKKKKKTIGKTPKNRRDTVRGIQQKT